MGVSRDGEVDHLLGPEGSPLLIDAAWDAYVAASFARHYESDTARRRAVSREVTAAWAERHKALRAKMGSPPAGQTVDGFIDAKLSEAGVKPTAQLTDL